MGRKTAIFVQSHDSKSFSAAVGCRIPIMLHQCTPRSPWDKTYQLKETSVFCSDPSGGSGSTHHPALIASNIYILKSPWQMWRPEAKISAMSQQEKLNQSHCNSCWNGCVGDAVAAGGSGAVQGWCDVAFSLEGNEGCWKGCQTARSCKHELKRVETTDPVLCMSR